METKAPTAAVTAEDGRRLLARAQQAWHDSDLQALVDALDPDVRIEFNSLPPIVGIAPAKEWLAERFRTQLDYRLSKQLRGVYGNTVVGQWTGSWHEADGDRYRAVGIELLTVGSDGRITHWEAAMFKERINGQ